MGVRGAADRRPGRGPRPPAGLSEYLYPDPPRVVNPDRGERRYQDELELLDGRSGSDELELEGISGSLDELLDGRSGSLELLDDGINGSLDELLEGIRGSLELELLGRSGSLEELEEGINGSLDELLEGIRGVLELELLGRSGSLEELLDGISGVLELELDGMSGVLLELLELLRRCPRSHSMILSHVSSRFMNPPPVRVSADAAIVRTGPVRATKIRDVTCTASRRVLTAGGVGRTVPPRRHPGTPTQEDTS